MLGIFALIAYAATIPIANWMIENVGTVCVPNGPCLIPVGFGLMAPSGVLVIGAALVLRDIIHRSLGWHMALVAIVIGCCVSYVVSPPALVFASVAAFALSELADLTVYTPLSRKRMWLAILASGCVGAVVDSAVFLMLAFGSLDHLAGQVVGKVTLTLLAALIAYSLRVSSRQAEPA
jgi:uncharacterized PurR-regulated membrane protein YhhQ (DUF165 family)